MKIVIIHKNFMRSEIIQIFMFHTMKYTYSGVFYVKHSNRSYKRVKTIISYQVVVVFCHNLEEHDSNFYVAALSCSQTLQSTVDFNNASLTEIVFCKK